MFYTRNGYPVLLFIHVVMVGGRVKFTNVKCIDFEPTYASTETCELKILKRGVVGMNVYMKLHQTPVTNVSINLSLHKKANGYRPFLYNITADLCIFLKHRTSYPLLKIFFDALLKDSNVNHTCPFDHDIIIRNWILKESDFRLLPLPEGDYVFKSKIGVYFVWKVDYQGYFSITD